MTKFFLTNCTANGTLQLLQNKVMAMGISSTICFVLTALILFLLLLYRVYRTVLQRLFQYLTVVTLVHLAFIIMDIHLHFKDSQTVTLCKWLGFLRQWTATVTYFCVFVITVFLLYTIHQLLRSAPAHRFDSTRQRAVRASLEVVMVISMIFLPLSFTWVPFLHENYGYEIYSTSCWIQSYQADHDCNKSTSGTIDQIAYLSVLRVVMIAVLIAFTALSVLFCRFACRYNQTRERHLKTIRQTFLLTCFFLLSSLIEITGLVMYIYAAITGKKVDNYTFWLVDDIAMPISQLIIPSGFLFYLYSFKTFNREELKKSVNQWKAVCASCCCCACKKKANSSSESIQNRGFLSEEEGTAPSSDRESPLSHTYFNRSSIYTGAFTTISNQVLVTSANHDYGSVHNA